MEKIVFAFVHFVVALYYGLQQALADQNPRDFCQVRVRDIREDIDSLVRYCIVRGTDKIYDSLDRKR